MAKIRLGPFAGVLPSRGARDLPPGGAQVAENLLLRYGDFRPVQGLGALATTVTPGAASVHRTPSGVELQSPTDADFVNGQINDPSVERVYVTGRSAYPEAWQSGSYRRLGVRTPSTAPTATVNLSDEFTTEERNTAVQSWVQTVRSAVLANLSQSYLGGGLPTTTSLGSIWLAHGADSELPTSSGAQIAYCVPMTGSTTTEESDAYLMNPLLAGKQINYLGTDYWAVPILWRAIGYTTNESAVATAIKAVTKPAPYTGQLVPNAVADEMASRIADIGEVTLQPLATLISRINVAQNELIFFVTRVLTDPARVYGLANVMQRLASAIQDIDTYFANYEAPMNAVLDSYAYLVPEVIDREVDTRFYLYTYVSNWGEESAPSPVGDMDEVDQNDTVTVTIPSPATGGGYGTITHWRLYRSSTTNLGAEYQFVAEIPIGTLTYLDEKTQEQLLEPLARAAMGGILQEPRSDMKGLCGGTNGIMLGFVGNTVCACEPYKPYAWPREYELSLGYDVVAIVFIGGQSWLALTEGIPYVISGADSANLTAIKLNQPQACVSKRSAVSIGGAALYASPDGICMADPSGVQVITVDAYTREDWQALTPATSLGAYIEGMYHLWVGGKLLTLDLASKNLTAVTETAPTAAYVDLLLDTLYTVQAGTGNVYPRYRGANATATYKSAKFIDDSHPSYGWLRAVGDLSSGTYTVWVDGNSIASGALTPNVPQRLPARRGREWEVQVQSAGRISYVELASTSGELSQ